VHRRCVLRPYRHRRPSRSKPRGVFFTVRVGRSSASALASECGGSRGGGGGGGDSGGVAAQFLSRATREEHVAEMDRMPHTKRKPQGFIIRPPLLILTNLVLPIKCFGKCPGRMDLRAAPLHSQDAEARSLTHVNSVRTRRFGTTPTHGGFSVHPPGGCGPSPGL
jgi:hypothetical protein